MKKFLQISIILLVILIAPFVKGQNQTDSIKVTLGGLTGGKITKEFFLNNNELKCSSKDYEVSSFRVSFIPSDMPNEMWEKPYKGKQFDKVYFEKALKNGPVSFEYIKVRNIKDTTKTLKVPPLNFKVE